MADDDILELSGHRPPRRRTRRDGVAVRASGRRAAGSAMEPLVDPHRAIVFPNRVREQRLARGRLKLLPFSSAVPEIPYIRLSKIERGTVFARADELIRIGRALDIAPADLLLDVTAPDFDIALWSAPFADGATENDEGEGRFAMILGAAVRARRYADPSLTAPFVDAEFGIPPVIISRIENAHKPLERWNARTVAGLCRMFAVPDEAALRAQVLATFATDALSAFIGEIAGPEQRIAQTRQRVAALAMELDQATPAMVAQIARPPAAPAARRIVPVFGAPLDGGLIGMTSTGTRIEAPAIAGPHAFGLRVCRATLGGGLPGQSTVIVDPDRYPHAGGLALVRDGEGHRLVSVLLDRAGTMIGYSVNPEREIALERLPASDVAAVIAAVFV